MSDQKSNAMDEAAEAPAAAPRIVVQRDGEAVVNSASSAASSAGPVDYARPQSESAAQPAVSAGGETRPVAEVRPANSDAEGGEGDPPVEIARTHLPHWLRDSVSWMASLVVHMAILLILGLWVFPNEYATKLADLVSLPDPLDESMEFKDIDPTPLESIDVAPMDKLAEVPQPETENVEEITEFSLVDDLDEAAMKVDLAELADASAMKSDLLLKVGAYQGGGLSGRGKASRQRLARKGGGNEGSEAAVALALRWLAAHQNQDGSWSFDHRTGPCQGRCGDPGTHASARNGATAMALLPFLGAGQTHIEGEYRQTVSRGLYYLERSMKVSQKGGSLVDSGNMYSHGLAAIALSEAYAMTRDPELRDPAQLALNYIMYAQDPIGGGWRYAERQAGDTSVVGWQIMALKSGSMAYLNVDPNVIKKAYHFLDGVQVDDGAAYGYASPGPGYATSAVGLLCRMYMGWKQDYTPLREGVERLAKHGPQLSVVSGPGKDNMYFNYYATQVLFQFTGAEGEMWNRWNSVMRDALIKTQSKNGHETGSWMMSGGHADAGGRVFCTSLATMILEVYYRHMPIFRAEATEEDFPE